MGTGKVIAAFPLTSLQEGMLYQSIRNPGSEIYQGQCTARFDGPLDVERFREAWRRAAMRHECFRTFFAWENRPTPLQVVREGIELEIPLIDWSGLSPEVQEARWAARREWRAEDAIPMDRAPMMRFELIRLSPQSHRLYWGVHHAVLDGWSGFSILREVLEDYEALGGGPLPERAPVPSYAQFVGWLQAQDSGVAESYWRKTLSGFTEPTPLPVRSSGQAGDRRGNRTLVLTAGETETLSALARELRVTLNTVVVAAWATILARHAGRDEVVFGVTVSERPYAIANIEKAAGLYLNTIPVRVAVPQDQPLSEWVRDLQTGLSEGRAHSAPGLAAIQRWGDVEDRGLFDSLVVFESFPPSISAPLENSSVTMHEALITGPSDLPLALQAFPSDTLEFHLVFDAERVSHEAAGLLLDQMRALLAHMAVGSASFAPSMPLVSESDRTRILETWSTTKPDAETWPDVVEAFARQVERTPDRLAVKAPDGEFTYRELDVASNAIGVELEALDRAPYVGIAAVRSRWYVAAVLAALKAEQPYVALDPAEPLEHRRAKMQGVDVVVTPDEQRSAFPETRTIPFPVGVWRATSDQTAESSVVPQVGPGGRRSISRADGTNPAYVIYTSGSTGRPKGVVVERAQLAFSNGVRQQVYGESPDVFLLLSPLTVDSAVAGFYWTLTGGGTLVIPRPRIEQDLKALEDLIRAHGVSHTLLVPSLYEALLEHGDGSVLSGLRTVVVAGEACRPNVLAGHVERIPHVRLFNEYGPSEATVWCTVAELGAEDAEITIGRPIPGARIYLLDEAGQPVPAGMAGELHIGGPGVARGYLDEAETASRFGENPFHGGRLYRTGDLASWTADGRIAFLGRTDEQLKVRGHRIEPQEIERALEAHPSVREAAAALVPASPGRPERLVGFLVQEGGEAQPEELATHLAERLPPFMVPKAFQVVTALPRTSAGKLDRRALVGIEIDAPTSAARERVPARGPIEEALLEIWQDVLGTDDIGVEDDFFALGGDSLLSIRVIARAGQAGFQIRPESFFQRPTIAHIADQLGSGSQLESDDTEQGAVTGLAPLTPIQHWFFENITEGRDRWNQCWALEVPDEVSPEEIEQALLALVTHHDALRLRLVRKGPESWEQNFAGVPEGAPLRVIEVGDRDFEAVSLRELESEQQRMKLGEGPLFRGLLFLSSGVRNQLLLLAHHAVVDGISWGILLEDLSALIESERAEPLPRKTNSALEWAKRLQARAEGAVTSESVGRWLAQPQGEAMQVPCDIQEEARRNRVADGATTVVTLDPQVTEALLRIQPEKLDTTTQELLLAGLMMAWKEWTGRSDLVLDTEGHGRDLLAGTDVSRTVGWFTSTFPIWMHLEEQGPVPALMAAQAAMADAEGGSYGLLRFLASDAETRRALAQRDRPELLFNYLSSTDAMLPSRSALRPVEPPPAPLRSLDAPRAYALEINARVDHGQIIMVIEHSKRLLRPQSITTFVEAWERRLHEIAVADRDPLAMSGLDADQLDIVGDLLSEIDDE